MTPATKRPKVGHHALTPKKRMLDLTARQICSAHNLAGIVDPGWSRVISPQSPQVLHHSVFPKKSVATWPSLLRARPGFTCQTRSADDLTSVVRACRAALGSPQSSEVDHSAVLPKEGCVGQESGSRVWNRACIRASDDQPFALVCTAIPRESIRTAQSAQIQHHSVFPQERVCRCTKLRGGIERRIYGRSSDYLPLIVDVISTALIATQRSEIDDLTILPKDGMLRQPARHRIEVAGLRRSRDPPTFIDHVGPTKVVETGQCAEVSQDTVLPLKSVREETIWVETQVWIGHVGIGGRDVRCPGNNSTIV